MLALLASAAFAQALPLPDIHPVPRGPAGMEVGQGAHWTAEAGRWTTLGGVGLATASLAPAAHCFFSGEQVGCWVGATGFGVGMGGVVAGLTMQGVGSYSYLRKTGQSRRGALAGYLVVGGAAGVVAGMAAPKQLGGVSLLGANVLIAGVVLLDVEHVRARRGRGVAMVPTFDVRDRTVGLAGRF